MVQHCPHFSAHLWWPELLLALPSSSVIDPRNQGKAALLETEFLALFRFSIMLGNLVEKKQLAKL
jgi:hypothetical protein